jgi:tetratricopeptide (TPR) repeat protein
METGRNLGGLFLPTAFTNLGTAEFWLGNWENAVRHFEEGAQHELPGVFATNASMLALSWSYSGRGADAVAFFDAKRDELPQVGGPLGGFSQGLLLFTAAEAYCNAGEREKAADLYPLLMYYMEKTGSPWRGYDLRLGQAVAGMAAAAGEKWDLAEEHFQTAMREAETIPARIEQPETRRFYAQVLIARDQPGDRERARQLLTEAIAMYRQIGMPRHLQMTDELAKNL